jgi:hypothetical protein
VPGRQSEQLADPGLENVPALQFWHVVEPIELAKVPASQFWHVVEADMLAKVPGSHGLQELAAGPE